jgi:hypothetical protein
VTTKNDIPHSFLVTNRSWGTGAYSNMLIVGENLECNGDTNHEEKESVWDRVRKHHILLNNHCCYVFGNKRFANILCKFVS